MGYAVGTQYVLVHKGQTYTVRYAVHSTQYVLANMVVGTITFSTKRSNPHSGVRSGYAVGVSAKRSTKRPNPHSGYAVGMQCTVHSRC